MEWMQEELAYQGPFSATFDVYEDFLSYQSGVYRHTTGKFIGEHAVKILGWGIEDNTPYWLCANSWNQYWGDQGFFKVLRGHDECGIEKFISGGNPMFNNVKLNKRI